jgi:hypothetical protein
MDSGLMVVVVSNPAIPTQTAFVPLARDPDAAAVVGSSLYVLAHQMEGSVEAGLRVFDVSDPAHPVAGMTLPVGGASLGGSIALTGRYAYVAASGLHVLHVGEPAHPVEVGFHSLSLNSVAADGSYAYP